MKYMGSKSRIAKYIVPIIQQRINELNLKLYIEPFVGGANVIDKIVCEQKIGCDKQKYLIALYQNLDKINQLPEFVTKEHYNEVKDCWKNNSGIYPDWYIGMIGFLASYNGKFFDGGYAGIVHTKIGTIRNYYNESKRNLEKQIADLQGIEWKCGDYKTTCSDLVDALIYCDPPYKDTTNYVSGFDFYHNEFWDWCREMSKRNVVIISEQAAADGFRCIWEHQIKRSIKGVPIDATEKLFEINNHAC